VGKKYFIPLFILGIGSDAWSLSVIFSYGY